MTASHNPGERDDSLESVRRDEGIREWQEERESSRLQLAPVNEGPARPSPAAAVLSALKEIAQIVLPAITLALLIHLFLAQATIVYGQSMQPNFRPMERLVMEKVTYYFRGPQHNEIVVLEMPDSNALMIKRVVGLPGDTVEIRQGQVFVNGIELAPPLDVAPGWRVAVDENEDKAPTRNGDSPSYFGPVTLAENTFFVLGDNRDNSNDSRAFGPAQREFIKGRVWVRYWPLTRFTVFH